MVASGDPSVQDYPDGLIRLSHEVLPDGLAMIVISGELDVATADWTVRYVSDVIDRHDGPVSADLSGLRFCDACGLGALIRISRYAQRSGRWVSLLQPPEVLTRIMRITGADSWLLVPAQAG